MSSLRQSDSNQYKFKKSFEDQDLSPPKDTVLENIKDLPKWSVKE